MKSTWASPYRASGRGFTIVEVLVVIVVIAILVSITVVSYNAAQSQARATAVQAGIEQIDKAMQQDIAQRGATEWPQESALGLGANPTIEQLLVASPGSGLSRYLDASPTVSNLDVVWIYDNDGDERSQTSEKCISTDPKSFASDLKGPNLHIKGLSRQVVAALDKAIDDGDLVCGKLVAGNADQNEARYQLSYDQSIR